jgi:glycosyltransferase involved in cell wall biosynthesis
LYLRLLESWKKKSLKVLMVSTEYPPMPGGVGRYTFNLTKALRKLGIEILVICNAKGNGDFYGLSPTNKENSQLLLKLVSEENPDIIHIQYEVGLYGLTLDARNPKNIMTSLDLFYKKNKSVPIVTTFHSNYQQKLSHWLNPTSLIKKDGRIGKLGIPIRFCVIIWDRIRNYLIFQNLIIEKLTNSNAGIMLCHYMSNLFGNGHVIYHGAEPSVFPQPSKEKARSFFSLPQEKKIALAVGFKSSIKDWDIFKNMNLPNNWIIVMNSSKSHYDTENYDIRWKENKINRNENTIIDLQKGFLDDQSLSMLFYAADVVLLPYQLTSTSGVMFDALAHGLPFIATDLKFFKEFSRQGLGITTKRKAREFSNAIKTLEKNYSSYIESINNFKTNLKWESVAKQHELIYSSVIKKNNKEKFQEIKIK